MAIKLIRSEWHPEIGRVKEFICDTKDDVANLPKCVPSSAALVADGGAVYIVNASGELVEL